MGDFIFFFEKEDKKMNSLGPLYLNLNGLYFDKRLY